MTHAVFQGPRAGGQQRVARGPVLGELRLAGPAHQLPMVPRADGHFASLVLDRRGVALGGSGPLGFGPIEHRYATPLATIGKLQPLPESLDGCVMLSVQEKGGGGKIADQRHRRIGSHAGHIERLAASVGLRSQVGKRHS